MAKKLFICGCVFFLALILWRGYAMLNTKPAKRGDGAVAGQQFAEEGFSEEENSDEESRP